MNVSTPDRTSRVIHLVAWIVVLLISTLPNILLQEVFGRPVSSSMKVILSVGVIAAAFVASLAWRPLRMLYPLLVLCSVLTVGQWLVYTRIDELAFIANRLRDPSFNVYMFAEQLLNLIVTVLMICALVLMKNKPRDFYLAKGKLDAEVEPVRWLGIGRGAHWKSVGGWVTLFISLGTLAFLVIAGRPAPDIARRALPFLPMVLLAAALNAFSEEITYRASFLSVLEGPVGRRQALRLTAVYFGILHYYGVPYGVIGVVLAGLLGWILGKSMQETHGMFWGWFIHFWQDVWIFSFLAIGSITPGGG